MSLDFFEEQRKKELDELKDRRIAKGLSEIMHQFGEDAVNSAYESEMRLKGYHKEYYNGSSQVSNRTINRMLSKDKNYSSETNEDDFLASKGIISSWKK